MKSVIIFQNGPTLEVDFDDGGNPRSVTFTDNINFMTSVPQIQRLSLFPALGGK